MNTRDHAGMSSCIDDLKSKGYYAVKLENGFIIRPDTAGSCKQVYGLFAITYTPVAIKKIRIKFNSRVTATGSPTATVYCATGFAIKRLVLWNYDPMQELMSMMNTLVELTIIIDTIRTLQGLTI
jgi:hypothetical protein